MDFATFVFLSGMVAAVAYISYIIFCDAYALVSDSVKDSKTLDTTSWSPALKAQQIVHKMNAQ
jgi:hypothetical protein